MELSLEILICGVMMYILSTVEITNENYIHNKVYNCYKIWKKYTTFNYSVLAYVYDI